MLKSYDYYFKTDKLEAVITVYNRIAKDLTEVTGSNYKVYYKTNNNKFILYKDGEKQTELSDFISAYDWFVKEELKFKLSLLCGE